MHKLTLAVLACLAVVALSAPNKYGRDSDSGEANYQYAWQVKAGGGRGGYGKDDSGENYGRTQEYGQSEARKGDRTDGKYWVQLPDGRLQTVEYYVDGDSGLIAKVSYDGSGEKRKY